MVEFTGRRDSKWEGILDGDERWGLNGVVLRDGPD
jgi:hypothetical protein